MTSANAANNLSNSLLAKRPRNQVEESSEDVSCAPQCKKGFKASKNNAEKSEILSVLSNSEDEGEEVKMMVTSQGSDKDLLSDQKQLSPKVLKV